MTRLDYRHAVVDRLAHDLDCRALTGFREAARSQRQD
jgi:hypothetical protein